MMMKIKKCKASAAMKILSRFMRAAGRKIDGFVDILDDRRRILIEPVPKQSYSIEALLDGITPENIHAAVDFGAPFGAEML